MAAVLALEVVWAVTLAQTVRRAVMAVGGRLEHVQAQRISMAGFTLSRVVPGGGAAGGLFGMRELTRLGHPASVAVTAMTASWATTITSLAVLILGGLIAVALLVGYGSANLLNSLPELTPGWLGVFEAALSATYISLGVPAGIAVAVVLVYRLASFWLPVAAGVVPAVRSLAASSSSPSPASTAGPAPAEVMA
jgi:uncharacterized membrane protein YbhN (UPF0104 family)